MEKYRLVTQPAARAFKVVNQVTMTDFSAVKTIPFDGKAESYHDWSTTFTDYLTMKKCSNMILTAHPDLRPDADTLIETDANHIPLIKLRDQNATAFSMLSLSTKGKSHEAVQNGKTTIHPAGNARQAWLNLKTIYKPINALEQFNLKQKFNKSELRAEGINPDDWFSELDVMVRQLNVDYNIITSDAELLQHVVWNIKPKMYQVTLQLIKREMSYSSTPLKLDNVKREIRQIWSQSQFRETGNANYINRKETALVMMPSGAKVAFPKRFKGDCRLCGKKGHKANDCWDNPKNKGKKPAFNKKPTSNNNTNNKNKQKLKCSYCGKENHTIEKCFKRIKDESPEESAHFALMTISDFAWYGEEEEEQRAEYCSLSTRQDITVERNKVEVDPNMWIMDSGSTSHMRFSKSGMTNLVPWKAPITLGNRQHIYSEMKGTFKGQILSEKGFLFDVTMDDVLYVPDIMMNLFSLTKTLKNKKIGFERIDQFLALIIDKNKLIFNKEIKVGTGVLLGVDIFPISDEKLPEHATTIISHERLHEQLGHPNKAVVVATAKKYGWKIKSPTDMTCESCAKGKAKRKKINKVVKNPATKKGERIFMDISSINVKSKGGNKFWLLLQDEFTDCIWSFFMKKKSDLTSFVWKWLKKCKQDGITIQHIRCDNAGENISCQQFLTADPLFNIKFEYTAPYTPEQNGTVERKFQTLYGKVRSMLNACHLPIYLRQQLWAHCAHLATLLEIILVNNPDDKSPYELWYDKKPSWTSNLRTFGEIGIIQDGALGKMKSKLTNRGFPAMFIGYPPDHSSDVFQFFVLSRRSIIHSRNVVWLNKSYGDYMKVPESERSKFIDPIPTDDVDYEFDEVNSQANDDLGLQVLRGVAQQMHGQPLCDKCNKYGHNAATCFMDSDSDDEPIIVPHPTAPAVAAEPLHVTDDDTAPADDFADTDTTESDASVDNNSSAVVHRVSGAAREHHNLTTFYNPHPSQHDEELHFAMLTLRNEGAYALASMGGNPEYNPAPANYYEAMTRKDSPQWWISICTEFDNMHDKVVWRIVKISDVPSGKKIIGNRWVFALKDDGTYRARTVGQGFSQVPGKDFQENHAPVVHDTTFRFCLVQMLIYGLSSGQFDVVTAFLYGNLEEIIYMRFPKGYARFLQEKQNQIYDENEYCLLLEKALYGLVQAARQWWKRMTEVMKKLGFFPSPADPCLFVKPAVNNQPPAFIILYVDDGGVIGTPEVIREVLDALKKEFKIKELGPMKNFVGCQITINRKRDTLWIRQPKLIKNLREHFSKLIVTDRNFKTPAAPRSVVMRPQPDDPTLYLEQQQQYRSGVGMLMYLVKHSRPDIANATRELTKVLDGATEAHWKAMMRIIKFVLDTSLYALRLKPNGIGSGKVTLRGISDSEFAGDRETRKSVYGYVTYYCGAPISWKSKSGDSVTLSSTEAEYYASSETAKELLFIHNLIISMEKNLELPIIMNVDNTGAIYLANNFTTGPRTKHIDIRAHFVRELIINGILKVVFVKSEDNDADIFTKNVSEDLFVKHSNKLMDECPEL